MKYLTSLNTLMLVAIIISTGIHNKDIKAQKSPTTIEMENSRQLPKIASFKKNDQYATNQEKKPTAPVGEVVGTTTYDIQTNSGMCRRIATNPQGTFVYVGWTMDSDFTKGAHKRGTGFNFYNRDTGKWGALPNKRIEPYTRTGWPNIGVSQGRQFSISHNSSSRGLLFTYRLNNQSDWNEINVGEMVNDGSGVLAKAVADRANIYCIMSRTQESAPFNGIVGGLHVIRSTDSGHTWESMGGLEENYGDSYALSMNLDTYQIDAANGTVSVVYGSILTPVVLYKSMDKAETWSKTIVQPMPGNQLVRDLNNDLDNPDYTVEPYFCSDGGNTVIIDSGGKSHVIFSSRIVTNKADNDYVGFGGQSCGLKQTAALFYWNEDMETPEIIGKSIMNDQNNNGILGSAIKTVITAGMPFYSNLITHPQLAIDGEDNLYVSYTAAVDGHYVPPIVSFESSDDRGETISKFTQTFEEESILYTDIFMLKSTNGGTTWQGPLNVTNASASEETYPSIQRFIRDTIFLVYQHDLLPGSFSRGPQDLATVNEIAVTKILPADISDVAAPTDSEPYLSVLYTDLIVSQNCNINEELNSRGFGWGLDYPEGLLTEIKSRGLVDYSQTGNFIDEIYVEDSVGNQSDPVQISVQVVAGEYVPPKIGEFQCEE